MESSPPLRRWLWIGAVAFVLFSGGLTLAQGIPDRLMDRFPRNPIVAVYAHGDNPAKVYDGLLGTARLFAEDDPQTSREIDASIRQIDEALGLPLRDGILALLGNELGFYLDFPSLDRLAAVLEQPGATPERLFREMDLCFLANTSAPGRLDAALRKVAERSGASLSEDRAGVHLSWRGGGPGTRASLHYSIHRGILAISFSPGSLREAARVRPFGQRLADGEDFRKVFSQLDPNPNRWFYLNVPRLRKLLTESVLVQEALSSQPAARRLFDRFVSPAELPTGFGMTVVEVAGGVRQTSFGPHLLSVLAPGRFYSAIVGAVAIPNLVNATNRGRQKRAMADIRAIATSIEEYQVDWATYPSTGGLWVDVSVLAPKLSPTYIRQLPRTDPWGHAYRYWSDGQSYVIVSPGKDGSMDQNWLQQSMRRRTTGFGADIVFKDGSFLQWPEGTLAN